MKGQLMVMSLCINSEISFDKHDLFTSKGTNIDCYPRYISKIDVAIDNAGLIDVENLQK